jgi:uncharacterized protein (TIGR03435 family)
MKKLFVLFVVFLGSMSAVQTPSFEAASVKVIEPSARLEVVRDGGPGTTDPGRIHFARIAMQELIMRAYDVRPDEVLGPEWIRGNPSVSNAYVVSATMEPTATKEQFQLMLQRLLAERFHLAIHREVRIFEGYDLTLGKGGPKLTEATPATQLAVKEEIDTSVVAQDGFPVLPPGPQVFIVQEPGLQRIKYQECSMAGLAYNLRFRLSVALGTAPTSDSRRPRVRDMTGVAGKYNFTLEFSCEGCVVSTFTGKVSPEQRLASSGRTERTLPDLFVALQQQLGLRLEKGKGVPVDVIVVDRVDKVPTSN